jgi:ABC-type polysaccharide/polyol phosphate transport system ATPase subunit
MSFRVRRSIGPALPEVDDLDHRASVSVEEVSRVYEPYRVRRIHRAMRIFGGLGVGLGEQVDDDDDDVNDGNDDDFFDEMEDVVERPKDQIVALHEVSFTAAGGSCVALVGPSGSGKSTLMNIVAGVAPPSSGRVIVHGLVGPILGSTAGLYPQYGKLGKALPTLGAFLHIPPRLIRHHLDEIFEFLGRPDLRPKLTSSVPGKVLREVLFATMLVFGADIVLIDLPMPGKEFGERVRERLTAIKASGGLVMIATPNVESVAWIADRVITLKKGSVAHDEPIGAALERVRTEQAVEADADVTSV